MKTNKYLYRDALYEAHTIYRDAMRQFIIEFLKKNRDVQLEELIRQVTPEDLEKTLKLHNEIEAAIDIQNIPVFLRDYWKHSFCEKFKNDKVVWNETEIIKNGRSHWAHPGLKDSDPEEVRTLLYHIIKVLGKIDKPEAKREVETIHNQLFSHDGEEHSVVTKEPLVVMETEKTVTEDISDELLGSKTMPKCSKVRNECEVGQFPTENAMKKYSFGSTIRGIVSHVADHAVFVKLEEGVEGRILKTELFWGNSDVLPSRHFEQGDELEVVVIDTFEKEDKRISLSLKLLEPNPWELGEETHLIKQKYLIGTKITGSIRNEIDSGVFVEIEPGINGFLPTPMPELLSAYGEVEATIFEINVAERQISLVGYDM